MPSEKETKEIEKNINIPDDEVLSAVKEYMREADDARQSRKEKNQVNMDLFHGLQDFSNKQDGQSTEFLPKVGRAAERISGFIKKALIDYGDWFDIKSSDEMEVVLPSQDIKNLLNNIFENHLDFATLMGDGIKIALLKSLLIVKVYGIPEMKKEYYVGKGNSKKLKYREFQVYKLHIDLINPDEFYPDPTGRNLYCIHRVEKDLHEVVALAEQGIYDIEVVNQIKTDYVDAETKFKEARDRNQNEAVPPDFRKRVVLDEMWGTLLSKDGNVLASNIVTTVVNEKYVIRKPEKNPYWHQKSPFLFVPLLRVPFSVWHKALFDDASSLNIALNDIFNLMVDGGLASVWGINQTRAGDLEDSEQISGGLQQGMNLIIKDTVPHGSKVVEQVSTGKVPPEAFSMFNIIDKEFQAATIDEIKMGMMPDKQVKATEVLQASQNSSEFLDSMVRDVEDVFIQRVIELVWSNFLQFSDKLDIKDIVGIASQKTSQMLTGLTAAEKYSLFYDINFRVMGLSQVISRAKEFQKIMALLQVASSNPLIAQVFQTEYSPKKIVAQLVKTLNLNPDNIRPSKEEIEAMKQIPLPDAGKEKVSNLNTAESSVPSDINQMVKPTGNF